MPKNNQRRLLMEAYGIIIHDINCPEKDYSAFYDKVIEQLSDISNL